MPSFTHTKRCEMPFNRSYCKKCLKKKCHVIDFIQISASSLLPDSYQTCNVKESGNQFLDLTLYPYPPPKVSMTHPPSKLSGNLNL